MATFAVNGPTLGLGSHTFYAVVTVGDQTYRTAPVVMRLVGIEPPFPVQISGAPDLRLSWPAIAGRRYDVLGADNVAGTFTVLATVTPVSTGLYTWPPPIVQNNAQRFYRIRVSP